MKLEALKYTIGLDDINPNIRITGDFLLVSVTIVMWRHRAWYRFMGRR